MSLRATTWALYEAPKDIDAVEFRILMIIADNCDENGQGFAYSVQRLADLAGVSKRTVQSRLRSLTARSLLTDGNQDIVAYLPGNKRPHVYDLVMIPASSAVQPASIPGMGAENASTAVAHNPVESTVETEEPVNASNNSSNRGAKSAPLESKNFEVRGATGVQQGCNRGARMFAPEPIETIETIEEREHPHATEKENQSSRQRTVRENRTVVRTSLQQSGYTAHSDDQAQALATALGLNLDAAWLKFSDYYAASGDKLADWSAKFRLWLRREKNYTTTNQPATVGYPVTSSMQQYAATSRPAYYDPTSTGQYAHADFYHTSGYFADKAREVLNKPTLALSEEQKLDLFPQALHILIDKQDARSVEEFITKEVTKP